MSPPSSTLRLVKRRSASGTAAQQRLGVGMVGRVENFAGQALLHDLAEIHDHDAIGQVAHHRQVMTDEQQRRALPPLNIEEQFGDRGLHRYIECGHGLIRHHQRRISGEGAGHADALFLSAGQLPRPTLGEISRQFDQVEELENALADAGVHPAAPPIYG